MSDQINAKSVFSNSTYDKLKWLALVGVPALGTLWFTLSQIWGFPKGEEILGTIMAINTAMGFMLDLKSRKYVGDGQLLVNDDRKPVRFVLERSPEEFGRQKRVIFNVTPEDKS